MLLTVEHLARMMDLSAVRTDVDLDEIARLADACIQYHCVCAFAMPCYVPVLVRRLAEVPEVGVGGVVGFPSGAESTSVKVAEAIELAALGVAELDMVMNVGMMRSGEEAYVQDDIHAVVEAAGPLPVKVILEAHYLTDAQLVQACRLAERAGVAFVKTGTGWAPTGATLENVRLMRQSVGESVSVKAAGGVRDLATVIEMLRRGVTRFGVGLDSGVQILEKCAADEPIAV